MASGGLIAEADFAGLAALLRELSGIALAPSKRAMASARLAPRLAALGGISAADYLAQLRTREGWAERDEFVSALTTNVTHFNREDHQFRHLAEIVLPGLARKLRRGQRVRLWSAGCSSGEEAYDLAFRILDACPEAAERDCRILATDIDRRILAKACDGCFPQDQLGQVSDSHLRTHFRPGCGTPESGATLMQVTGPARDLISFRRLNLQADWPFSGRFDVIMCRNVMIYFAQPTQARLWHRLAGRVTQGGTFCIGHSESLPIEAGRDFHRDGANIFRKRMVPDRASTARGMPPPTRDAHEHQGQAAHTGG